MNFIYEDIISLIGTDRKRTVEAIARHIKPVVKYNKSSL